MLTNLYGAGTQLESTTCWKVPMKNVATPMEFLESNEVKKVIQFVSDKSRICTLHVDDITIGYKLGSDHITILTGEYNG